MTTPAFDQLPYYQNKKITNSNWDNLLLKIIEYLTSGEYDVNFNSLTAVSYSNLPSENYSNLVCGEDIVAGNVVILKAADNLVYKATNANVVGITNVLGIATDNFTSGQTVTISKLQYTSYTGLTEGATYYISTGGAITSTKPTANIFAIGIATSTTTLIIKTDAGDSTNAQTIQGLTFNVNTISSTIDSNLILTAYAGRSVAIEGVTFDGGNVGAFTLTGKLTAGSTEIEGSNFDINGGDISAATISGGLTWAANQNFATYTITNVSQLAINMYTFTNSERFIIKSSGTNSNIFTCESSGNAYKLCQIRQDSSNHGEFILYDSSENASVKFNANGASYIYWDSLGIGTETPLNGYTNGKGLHIYQSTLIPTISIEGGNAAPDLYFINGTAGTNQKTINFNQSDTGLVISSRNDDRTAKTNLLKFDTVLDVVDSTANLYYSGKPSATTGTALILTAGNLIAPDSSSIRYKQNIKPCEIDSELIYDLRPVCYEYKLDSSPDLGFIAEDVYQIEPLLTSSINGQLEGVRYNRLTVLLIMEIKKLRERVKTLEFYV